MKRLLRITVLFSVTLLWWGEKGYAATPAMDAAEKETVSATVEAEADKKDPKSDKKSGEPKRKRNLGHLSGSFETNTIYYVEDSKTGAVVPHNSYGSNNFLKLDYQLGRFSAGVQLEYYPHPLVGTPMQGYEYVMEGFSINNLTEKYISWTDRNYSVTVGDFYEQFGSGLILRAWEDRALGFNNSLGGARVTFNIKDIVEGKVLYAFPRFNLGYLSTQIAGGDLSFSLSNAIGLLDHRLSLEGSIVNRHFKNLPSWYTEYRDDYDFDLSKNVISYSGRVNYEYRGLSAKFEYVGKSKDVYLDNMTGEEVFKRGDAQLFEIGYTGSNYAVMAQFRRLNYMQSQLYRPDGGSGSLGLLPGNTINYIPALSPQHTYMLAGLDPNSPQQNGEIGGQIDAFYTFRRGTAIGGKRGLKIHANYARYYSINGTMSKPGTNFYYRDFSFDIDKSWNSKLRTVLFVSLQKNAMHGGEDVIRQNVFVADVTYKFTPKFSLRAELQYLYAPHAEGSKEVDGDWVAGLLEASFAPKWSIFVQDMYNHGGSEINYYSAGASFTHSFIRIALSYGRNRAGYICSGGVCREMPAYTGGNLAMTLTF
ncbi:DUF6029 family protein [Alistipes putredinis]|uniref:DUF6029 family protein n=1 Tax=Alistipes putredinis TaxID=28117 RepID=UPI003AAD23D2